jgi:tyrosine-protein kinase Etk/Wzc
MDQDFNYLRIYKIISGKWYYIAIVLMASVVGAYLFLQLATPDYRSNAAIKLDDKKSELSELISIKNIYDRTNKSEAEKFILYSRNVLNKAISNLNYPVTFYRPQDAYRISSIYPQQPIAIQVHHLPKGKLLNTLFKIERINPLQYQLSYTINKETVSSRHAYGELLQFHGFAITLKSLEPGPDQFLYFKFNDLNHMLLQVKESLVIDDNQNTNILHLSYTDQNPYFARDILNSIIQVYLSYDQNQRSVAVRQTAFYIDTLLKNMAVVLKQSGTGMQTFKTANHMLDVSSNGENLLHQLANLEAEKHRIEIQSLLTSALQKNLQHNRGENPPNFNLQGVDDLQLIALIQKYNMLTDQRSKDQVAFPATSAVMLQLDEELLAIKTAMMSNISSQQLKNKALQHYLKEEISTIKKHIAAIPGLERTYINLQSDYKINQKVYDYLSEKKLEAHISSAAVTPGAHIIDQADVGIKPVYPIAADIYKDFILSGLIVGLLSIFIVRRLNPYIYDVETIVEHSRTPIIGFIRQHEGKQNNSKILTLENPSSRFSESIRAMRSNLDDLTARKYGQVICITSEIAGEGKSFTALNLAGILCLNQKKVVIVATDLRNSKLHHTFQTHNEIGLSNYLMGTLPIDKLALSTKYQGLDLIPAGPLTDHPAELLHSDKMIKLLAHLKKNYDFIILDSAPIGLVSDSIPLMRMADINLFLIRSGISSLRTLKLPDQLVKDLNLRHMAMVLNAFKENHIPKGYYSLSSNEQGNHRYYKLINPSS